MFTFLSLYIVFIVSNLTSVIKDKFQEIRQYEGDYATLINVEREKNTPVLIISLLIC